MLILKIFGADSYAENDARKTFWLVTNVREVNFSRLNPGNHCSVHYVREGDKAQRATPITTTVIVLDETWTERARFSRVAVP